MYLDNQEPDSIDFSEFEEDDSNEVEEYEEISYSDDSDSIEFEKRNRYARLITQLNEIVQKRPYSLAKITSESAKAFSEAVNLDKEGLDFLIESGIVIQKDSFELIDKFGGVPEYYIDFSETVASMLKEKRNLEQNVKKMKKYLGLRGLMFPKRQEEAENELPKINDRLKNLNQYLNEVNEYYPLLRRFVSIGLGNYVEPQINDLVFQPDQVLSPEGTFRGYSEKKHDFTWLSNVNDKRDKIYVDIKMPSNLLTKSKNIDDKIYQELNQELEKYFKNFVNTFDSEKLNKFYEVDFTSKLNFGDIKYSVKAEIYSAAISGFNQDFLECKGNFRLKFKRFYGKEDYSINV